MSGDTNPEMMNHFLRIMATTLAAATATIALLQVTYAAQAHKEPSAPSSSASVFLPIIHASASPTGSYYCYEYEFGLIWTSEVITLHADGSSIYAYNPPYAAVVTGTWGYMPTQQEVSFTNFRWLTTTFRPPDSLWASRYITYAGFEVAISCHRLK